MDRALDQILKAVSRSFYLSIHVLPQAVRSQIAVGYLLARAADTIADTEILPPGSRLHLLSLLREVLAGAEPARLAEFMAQLPGGLGADSMEAHLLGRLPSCLDLLHRFSVPDQELLRWVLLQLLTGMERDLTRFPATERPVPPTQVIALPALQDLDEYTYFAAGCVGEFWTRLCAVHLGLPQLLSPDLMQRGINLGKALQLVNVIRDAPQDLLAGRCYWPADLLRGSGLRPMDLAELVQQGAPPLASDERDDHRRDAVLRVTTALCRMAGELCDSAWPYVQAIPKQAVRLRLSCSWPLHVATATLLGLRQAGSPLFCPARPVKVKRRQIYAMLLRSTGAALLGHVGP